MPIYSSKKKKFAPAPEGLWDGMCIDVVDKGIVPTQWGPKHKVQFRWVVNAEPKRTDGKPHMISMSYNNTLDEKSNLRKMLELWRGRKFTPEELKKFDLETTLNAPCQIQVAQDMGEDGDPYAFPQVVMKARPGPRVLAPEGYVREQNRPGYKPPHVNGNVDAEQPEDEPDYDTISDEEIPF
jgi:hypothetical protein